MPELLMGEADFVIRAAIPDDAIAIASLATDLGYPNNRAEIADRLEGILQATRFRWLQNPADF